MSSKPAHPEAHFLAEACDRLRRQSRKLTGPRQAVLEVLGRQSQPLSIKEISRLLRGGTCDPATVYRSIRLLEGMGLVEKFNFDGAIARYKLKTCGRDHHHHLICTRCSEVVEVGECFSSDLEKRVAVTNGFKGVTHKLEFFGICPRCQPGE